MSNSELYRRGQRQGKRGEGSKNTTQPTDPGDHDSLGQKHMLLVSEQINDWLTSKNDISLFCFSSKMTM